MFGLRRSSHGLFFLAELKIPRHVSVWHSDSKNDWTRTTFCQHMYPCCFCCCSPVCFPLDTSLYLDELLSGYVLSKPTDKATKRQTAAATLHTQQGLQAEWPVLGNNNWTEQSNVRCGQWHGIYTPFQVEVLLNLDGLFLNLYRYSIISMRAVVLRKRQLNDSKRQFTLTNTETFWSYVFVSTCSCSLHWRRFQKVHTSYGIRW